MKGDSETLQVYICLLVAVVKEWVIVDHSNNLINVVSSSSLLQMDRQTTLASHYHRVIKTGSL